MKKLKGRILFLAISYQLLSGGFSAMAQMNRSTQANNITSNIYQNASHAITGASLQAVMLNQNNSYLNLLSDTNLLDIRLFSTYAIYTPGMGVFYGDSLYMSISTQHGAWNRLNWLAIAGSVKKNCYLLCSDTGAGEKLMTYYDTNAIIASKYYTLSLDTSYFPGTGINMIRSSKGIHVSNTGLLFSDSNIAGGFVTPTQLNKDTTNANSFLVGQSYLDSYVTNHSTNYLKDTVGGSGITPKLVTQKYQATILSSYLTIADSSFMSSKTYLASYIITHATNYLTDTVGGSGTTPKLVTQKYQATILGSYLTIADSSFMSSKTYLASYVTNHATNYLSDTVGGAGITPKLVTQKYQATILGSYLTIADSSFMSSKTYMGSYVANHLSSYLTIADSSFMSSKTYLASYVTNHATNYLGDTVGGAGITPKLVTQKYQATILGSYLTIADSSFMSSKTYMGSYVANHLSSYVTIADSSFMSSKTYMGSYVVNHLSSYLTIADSSFMSSKTYMESYFANHITNYLKDTVGGTGTTPKLVTQKYQATILGSYLTIADSSFMSSKTYLASYVTNHATNYLSDTVGGAGTTPKLVTQKYQATILGSYLTIADSSFMSSKTYLASYVTNHATNYLSDTVGGAGTTPKLVTQKYQATILGSYLTIADSSFMSSKTYLASYVTNHSWSLTGNIGTKPSTNFIGTIDTATLILKVDNSLSGWIDDGKYSNTFFGYKSGIVSTVTNSGNTGIGYEVLLVNNAGVGNNGFGYEALLSNTSGYYNTAIGSQVLSENTTANNNTGVGYQALLSNTTGTENTASGFRALYHNTTGSSSTALGNYAGYNSTGSGNTFTGDSAGYNNTIGKYNIYVGYGAGYSNKSLSNQIYLGDSTGIATPTAVKFAGLLEPYYSSGYQTGTSGQVLTSQGSSGGAPQWETPTAYTAGTGLTLTGSAFSLTSPITIATGGMGGTHISTDSIGSDSNSFFINGHNQVLENDSVYYTSSIGNSGSWGVKINVSLNNMVDGETVNTLYYKKTTKFSILTFPANASATAYTISQSSHGLISGQTFSAETTTGTTLYLIKTQLFHSRYIISIIQITP